MFLTRAMRYYRVWIYACNVALFASALVFAATALWTLTDARMALFPSVQLYQPTFLYGFFALLIQAGVLQAVGCVGAVRMNEKLLSVYWHLLVLLLLGDAIVGVVWMFRYNFLLNNLRSDLKTRLNQDYGFDDDFKDLWDRIQSEWECCGIDGPYDYNATRWLSEGGAASGQLLPRSCCRPVALSHLNAAYGQEALTSHRGRRHRSPVAFCAHSYATELIFHHGCYDAILKWLQRSADVLAVLGFCVITFLKVCFAIILRYEIKEMIQKIQVIKGSEDALPPGATPLHELEAYLPRSSIVQESQSTLVNPSQNSPQTSGVRPDSAGRRCVARSTEREPLIVSAAIVNAVRRQSLAVAGGSGVSASSSLHEHNKGSCV